MTAESYTPTTDEVRAVWREWNGYGGLVSRVGPEPTTRAGMVAEFDRWLDQVKADARREGQAEALRQAAYVAGDVAPDGMGGNDWFPSEWSDYVAAWLEYRADRIEGDGVVEGDW